MLKEKGKNLEDLWEITLNRLIDDWDAKIWDIPNVKNNHPEKSNHPCQFPVKLVERYILALSNEYVDIGLKRIDSFLNGELITRPIHQEIYKPKSTDKVAQIPTEWTK
ncbi:DNA methyltransferase [Helicobacter cappadocius]|uniref:DNA methyltransferase n=1 Tax=Helicobacter cappadocius TaxID=3063998 RepID=A0AA90T9X7_9HELI|nr:MULTISPECIES: DNA methyltransferase [unclassified Helicobacter]MDO7253404.1 DNA methyltransferase [Helicobacter sp. faydin-H75]MDP2539332.1 DNA methyltransferase [Helicobacter sp. faydin-H76]